MAEEKPKLKSPKGAKSRAWLHFGFEIDDEGKTLDDKKVRCKICDEKIAFSGNTTNLTQHLRNHHPEACQETGPKVKQATLEQVTGSSQKRKPSAKRCSEITGGVAEFIARDMRPVAVVEGQGFRHMMNILEPGYVIPSRKTMTTLLFDMQRGIRSCLMEELGTIETVALTTDFWTSAAVDSYLGVTCHYISPQWQLCSRVLQTKEVPESHTAENVADRLLEVVREWKVEDKCIATTTDNGRNIVNALVVNFQWPRVPCFAHTLQLAVKAGLVLPTVSSMLSKCRKIVGHFRHSYLAKKALEERQEQLDLPIHKMIQDVSTRWNSSYYMLERILEQQTAVQAVLGQRNARHLMLSPNEITMIESIHGTLKPLAEATTLMCTEKWPSISMVQPVLAVLLRKHLSLNEMDPKVVSDMKTAVADNLKKHIENDKQQKFCLLASILDPRFKALKFLPSADRSHAFEELSLVASEAFSEEEQPDAVAPSAKRKKPSDFFELSESSESENGSADTASGSDELRKELDNYKRVDQIDRDMDPLEWWSVNGHRFKTISKLARKFLCVQATSVPSERLFSKSGNIVSTKRASLAPKTVDCLVFLSQNL